MTFARHLALRGATRAIRTRSYQSFIRRSLASEAAQTPVATSDYAGLANSSLFAEDQDGLAEDLTQAYHNKNTLLHTTAKLGSEIEPHYKPTDVYVNPPTAADVTVEMLIASQTHLGHSTSLWHPANSRYIFGVREGIHIISSDITAAHLRRAAKVVAGVAERGGNILFMNSRKGHERMVVIAAKMAGACHMFEKWLAGTITNGEQILQRSRMKVVDEFDNEVEGFETKLDALPVLKPDLIVCFNPLENYVMLHECGLANIPTVGIIDTDTNPTWVTYPIPANDDSIRSVALITAVLGRAGQEGRMARLEAARKGIATYNPALGLMRERKNYEGETGPVDNEGERRGASGVGDQRRMGEGSNYVEAGVSPRSGAPMFSSGGWSSGGFGPTGADVPDDEDTASQETKATSGKEQSLVSERDFGDTVDASVLENPLRADPAGSQGPPAAARQFKQEDKEVEQGGSQVR